MGHLISQRQLNVNSQSPTFLFTCTALRQALQEGRALANIQTAVVACMCSDSQLFATPWTVVSQTPLSMGVSRQKHWSGLPFPSPGDLPDPGIEPGSAAFQADSLLSEPPGKSKNFIFLSFPPECYLFKANDCLLGPLSHSRTQRRTWHNEQAQK